MDQKIVKPENVIDVPSLEEVKRETAADQQEREVDERLEIAEIQQE